MSNQNKFLNGLNQSITPSEGGVEGSQNPHISRPSSFKSSNPQKIIFLIKSPGFEEISSNLQEITTQISKSSEFYPGFLQPPISQSQTLHTQLDKKSPISMSKY